MGMASRHLIPYGVPKPPIGDVVSGKLLRDRLHLGSGAVFLSLPVLEEWKGIRLALDAFGELEDDSARLVIVGGAAWRVW